MGTYITLHPPHLHMVGNGGRNYNGDPPWEPYMDDTQTPVWEVRAHAHGRVDRVAGVWEGLMCDWVRWQWQ